MINKYCVGEFNGRRLYTGLRLDYRLATRAMSAVAEFLVALSCVLRIIFVAAAAVMP